MRWLARLSWAGCLLLLLAAVIVGVGSRELGRQAVLAQRVTPPDPEIAELFGGEPTPIGSPELYIVNDPKAVLPEKGPDGEVLLNETYLEETGTYPLQLKTVQWGANLAMWGLGSGALLAALVGWVAGRRARRLSQSPSG